ncbi:unnamed protein product [Prunus armeniaca]
MAILTSFATFCVKKVNKMRLAEYIEAMSGVKFWSQVSLDTMFDVHTKRILEYKRRLLNILGIIHRYDCIEYSRTALLLKYIQDEHEACTRRGRNLLSQSLLRPPGSAPEKDQTRLASCLGPSDRLAP